MNIQKPLFISYANMLSRHGIFLLVGLSILIHAALFLYDLENPQASLTGDRANQRMVKIESLLQTDSNASVAETLVNAGSPGDYVIHAAIYSRLGMHGVIVTQILLQLIGIVYVYLLGRLLFDTRGLPLLAAAVYAFLPAGLLHPHVLVSEAFFNPLIVVSFYHGARYLSDPEAPVWHLLISAIAGTAASFVRLIYVIYPFLFAGILLLWRRHPHRIGHTVSYLLLSIAAPLLWASYMFAQTGNFTMGKSSHDLSSNLYGRVERMGQLGGFELTPEQQQHRGLGLSEYLDYVSEHPKVYLTTLRSDVTNILLNSGINSFLGRYLGLYEMPKKTRYWRNVRDKYGLWGMIKAMYAYSPTLFFVNIFVTLFWFAFIGPALIGVFVMVSNHRLSPAVRAVLVALPAYLLLASQAAISVRWGFRTPFEFIMVLLFVAAVSSWLQGKQSKEVI
jgi:hypothetical protein